MVDEIGGIDDAIAYAAKSSDLSAGGYEVKVVPSPKTLADILNGTIASEHQMTRMPFIPKIEISPDSVLNALSPQLRKELARQVQMAQLLEHSPVVLVAPFTVTVK